MISLGVGEGGHCRWRGVSRYFVIYRERVSVLDKRLGYESAELANRLILIENGKRKQAVLVFTKYFSLCTIVWYGLPCIRN